MPPNVWRKEPVKNGLEKDRLEDNAPFGDCRRNGRIIDRFYERCGVPATLVACLGWRWGGIIKESIDCVIAA